MIQFATRIPTELEILADAIAELATHIDAATYRLLVMIREFDERAGWNRGFRSCAHWLNWRTGIDLGAARERVRVARALGTLPILSKALETGILSYSKVRALTRVATPANEAQLQEVAIHATAAHVERIVRTWRGINRREENRKEDLRHESRKLSMFIDVDGMYVIHGRLDPETGAALAQALEMATDELYRNVHDNRPFPTQQRADALGLVAELALSNSSDARISGGRAERFQVVLHVDDDAIRTNADDKAVPAEISELADGVRVSAETSRRLTCDATRVVMKRDNGGNVLDVGRRTRTVPPSLRRALERRDHGCRFPGCGVKHCDAHHVKHWADGGPTSAKNLVLLCRFHHRMVHEDGFSVETDGVNDPVFRSPHGFVMENAPVRRFAGQDASRQMMDDNEDAGLDIDANTAPLWKGAKLDLHYTMRVLLQPRPTTGCPSFEAAEWSTAEIL